MAGYLGTNVYRTADDMRAPTPVERMTGHRPRAVRNNSHVGPAIAARTDTRPTTGTLASDYDAVAWRTPNGSMSGGWVPADALRDWLRPTIEGVPNTNGCALPAAWRDVLREVADNADDWARPGRGRVYVVFSYDTPIGWVDMRDDAPVAAPLLTVPDVRYSNTTTQHQSHAVMHVSLTADGALDYSRGYVYTGEHTTLPDVDPGEVRKGRGASPFGPRRGDY